MLTILAEAALRSFVLGGVVWLGLNLFRVRNPHVLMASWIVVLAASLAMPLLMHWARVTVTLQPPPMPAPEHVWPGEASLPDMLGASMPSEISGITRGVDHSPVDWWAVAMTIYVFVAGMLLLRLAIGICLTWRLARAATPLSESCAGNADVRVCDAIGGPVTFGSAILVPPDWTDWDMAKRRAVLAHEGAHVANRDFYVLLLASLNRAVFWFSPFAWWQLKHMAELAEAISDAGAIEVLEDKLSYAEFLLELVQHARQRAAGLQGEVHVLLADDATLRRLNREFRGKNNATDVLSFPASSELDGGEGIAGDLAISLETASRQAARFGHTLRDEVRILLVHGDFHRRINSMAWADV